MQYALLQAEAESFFSLLQVCSARSSLRACEDLALGHVGAAAV